MERQLCPYKEAVIAMCTIVSDIYKQYRYAAEDSIKSDDKLRHEGEVAALQKLIQSLMPIVQSLLDSGIDCVVVGVDIVNQEGTSDINVN